MHQQGSVTAAAVLVHLSQPAASAMIRNLEARLGFALFTREQRRLVLTANGRALLPEVLNAAAALDAVDRLSRDLQMGWTRRLVIGTIAVAGVSVIPDTICAMRAKLDGISVQLRTGTALQVAAWSADQLVDCGVIIGPVTDDRLVTERLGEQGLYGVMHPSHPFTRRKRLDLAGVVSVPYIALARDLPIGAATAVELEAIGAVYAPAVEVTQTASAWALIEQQVGIAILDTLGAIHASRRGMAIRRLMTVPAVSLNLVWSRGRGLSRHAQAFATALAFQVAKTLDH